MDELQNNLINKKNDYDNLYGKTEKSLWIDDLDKFEIEYAKMMNNYHTIIMNDKNDNNLIKKKPVKKVIKNKK
jgi:hypothetical protein